MLAKVFQSGNSQAVRLPKDFRLDVKEVEIFKDGNNVILKPIKKDLVKAFHALTELKDVFADFERDNKPPQVRNFNE